MAEEQNQQFQWNSIMGTQASAKEWLFPGSDSKTSSLYQHERYRLRKTDIGVCVLGIIVAFAYTGTSYNPPVTHYIAFLPLLLSIVWDVADIASPQRIFKHGMPLGLLVFLDSLSFLSFLALLIVNGLVGGGVYYWRDDILVATYATIPWMATSAIHGFIAFKTIWSWARWVDPNSSRGEVGTCPDCKRCWKSVPEEPSAGDTAERSEHYSLLDEGGVEHEDVEASAST